MGHRNEMKMERELVNNKEKIVENIFFQWKIYLY